MTARGLFLTRPGELELCPFEMPQPVAGQVRVRIAGCGVCHTDVSFYDGAVRTKHPLPLILGHEMTGTVEIAPPPFEHLAGKQVLVPAVVPCDRCDLCRAGRENACTAQLMPGNDVHGGFATHVVVPGRHLVTLPQDLGGHTLAELAVVADAVTTPYQALHRAGVATGDLVIVVGVGGIGTYAVQIARAFGARVAAVDIEEAKLEALREFGVEWGFNARRQDGRAIKHALLTESGVSTARWRIFEMSGTAAGQELAWALLPPAGTLGVIGFTMDKPSIRLSNLMALDATAFGSWGCNPRLYPAALALVLSGRVRVRPFIEPHALDEGPALFSHIHASSGGGLTRRPILIPQS